MANLVNGSEDKDAELRNKLYMISRPLIDSAGNEITLRTGHGGIVTDEKGKEYVDFNLGFGPVILGHGNKEFLERLSGKLSGGLCFPSYSTLQRDYAVAINAHYFPAKALGILPTSSESILAVLRICSVYTGKRRFIRKGYIGWHDKLLNGNIFWHEPVNAVGRRLTSTTLTYINTEGQDAVNWVDNNISTFKHLAESGNISCFIFDAYQTFHIPEGIIDKAIELCKRNGILVIMDETKTSGRLCPFGSFIPKYDWDFTILGKAIGNGMPVSVFIGYEDFTVDYDAMKIGGTYSRQVAGTAAALSTMEIMQANSYYDTLQETGKEIARIMNRSFEAYGLSQDIQTECWLNGCMLEFSYSDRMANDTASRRKLYDSLLQGGIIIPYGHVFFVCQAHRECLDLICKNIDISLRYYLSR
jgi:glutamate-1-semialdehyde 2,1-aminomutase